MFAQGVRGGAGSTVVFTADGLLLTNAHVVTRARSGRAVFADGTEAGREPVADAIGRPLPTELTGRG